ncbi:unnamed protein product [Caenorhabditis sp. 36 PRJEB53466]|nr:unnamed protein product [Caenorhabditis sp. 36 PRJEB53466]
MPADVRNDYQRLHKMIVSTLRARVAKITFRRPPQFPDAIAQLMENGNLRIKFARSVIVRKVENGEIFNCIDGTRNKREAVNEATMQKVNEVYDYLVRFERCLGGMGELTCFPIVFSAGPNIGATCNNSPSSLMPSTSSRFAFSNISNTQQSLMPRSAPFLTKPHSAASRPPSTDAASRRGTNDENSGSGWIPPKYKFRMDSQRRIISIEASDGRVLRHSTRITDQFIFMDPAIRPDEQRMAFRFGRSHWQDADRLNLMLVCQQHQQWDQRLKAMREIYTKANYPPGYFTENSCREELERLMSLPTPNLRLDVSTHFVYSRKIMMEKWVEHFTSEVRKQQKTQSEVSLVTVRNNTKLIQEAFDPNTSQERILELVTIAKQCADKHKNDGNYKRIVGSLDACIKDKMQRNGTPDLAAFELPPTKPPGDDVKMGTRGFLTPTRSMTILDFNMVPMLSIADAVREAAPLPIQPEPAEPEIPSLSSLPSSSSIPDEILEPEFEPPVPTSKSPVKSKETKKEREKPVEKEPEPKETKKDIVQKEKTATPAASPQKSAVPESPKPKKEVTPPPPPAVVIPEPQMKEPSPLEVKLEETSIKEEEDIGGMTPSQNLAAEGPVPMARGRGRPRSVRTFPHHQSNKKDEMVQNSSAVSTPSTSASAAPTNPSKKSEKLPEKVDKGEKAVKTEKAETPTVPDTAETTPAPIPSVSAKKRVNESSTEPAASSCKKSRILFPRRKKEGTDEPPSSSTPSSIPPVPRSDGSFDTASAGPATPGTSSTTAEIEVQTDITIRQMISDISMGERRRTFVSAQPIRKGRKSQLTAESGRSHSRASSSASTSSRRERSHSPRTTRSAFCQTNVRFDLEKDDVVVMRVDPLPRVFYTVYDLDTTRKIVVNEETCKEIAAENAALTDHSYDVGKRAAKVDGKREMVFIVESKDCVGQRLITEKNYQLVSQTCDLPSSGPNESPVKRPRRDEKTKEDGTNIKYQLNNMFRALYDCPWAEPFKKPVPYAETGYDLGVRQRVDLSMIKREIENGVITTTCGFLHRAYRMLSNALMYNGFDHEVYGQAKKIVDRVMIDITSSLQDERRGSQSRRGRQDNDQRPTSRSGSMEPEPMTPLGAVGTKRAMFRKNPNVGNLTSTSGSIKSKKSSK